jgi:hypothetical protein
MSNAKNTKSRYTAINATFPTEVAELYNETVATQDPYSAEVVSEFGRPPPYFTHAGFVPPRAKQFKGKFTDVQGRSYNNFPDQPEWLAVKIPNRNPADTDPLWFPELNEVIETGQGKFKVLDLALNKTRKTTAMIKVEKLN